MSVETVTVCNRCGSRLCVGREECQYDGLPHETADVPKWKLDRTATRVIQPRKAM